ncbi:MAG: DNA repair exonuclease, partial [Actinomycetota bacterium]|nr:DNA repair exonuclease [Actinomycetota bacterium]
MARAFTFIHTADLHLDAPFAGIDAADPRVREVLVDSTYAALDRIVSVAVERGVDFVLIAGDAYNSRDKSLRAQLRFKAACERLSSAGVPVFIAQGNHDPADGWTANLTFPQSVRYFATDAVERIEVLDPESGEPLCALYGRGYATGPTKLNLARGFKRESADENAVAVLHANVGGQADYESYAPCTMDDLRAAGMDYWALGHIHKPSELSDSPRVRYAGSPQG